MEGNHTKHNDMKHIKTAILIAGILVAGLAYNTTFAQENIAENASAKHHAHIGKKIHHNESDHAKDVKHEKAAEKHQTKKMHALKHSKKTHPKAGRNCQKVKARHHIRAEKAVEKNRLKNDLHRHVE